MLRRFRCNYRGCLIVFNVLKAAWLRHFPCCAYIDGAVAPVAPAGPCGPWIPWIPCGPCGPVGPAAPGIPCGPCGPGTPIGPVGPMGPGAPIGPVGPTTQQSLLGQQQPSILSPQLSLLPQHPGYLKNIFKTPVFFYPIICRSSQFCPFPFSIPAR